MTFDINKVVKMLRSFEEVFGILVSILVRNTVIHYLINTFVSVELSHLSLIDSTLGYIHLVHDIQNCCDTSLLQSLNIHLIKWIRSHKDAAVSNLLEKELVKEITISLVHPTINNENLI